MATGLRCITGVSALPHVGVVFKAEPVFVQILQQPLEGNHVQEEMWNQEAVTVNLAQVIFFSVYQVQLKVIMSILFGL